MGRILHARSDQKVAVALVMLVWVALNSTGPTLTNGQVTRTNFQGELPSAKNFATVDLYPRLAQKVSKRLTDGDNIRLADVAKVYAADPTLRSKLENLDIDELDEKAERQTISRTQVEIRIQLANLYGTAVRVTGSPETVVEKAKPNPSETSTAAGNAKAQKTEASEQELRRFAERLIKDIQATAAEQYAVDPAQVYVTLNQPPRFNASNQIAKPYLQTSSSRPSDSDEPTFRSANWSKGLPSDRPSRIELLTKTSDLIGKQTLQFIDVSGRDLRRGSVNAEIWIAREALTATTALERGQQLTSDNTRLQKKMFDSIEINQVVGGEALGKYVVRPVRPGNDVLANNLGVGGKNNQIVVRSGDQISLQIVIGETKIMANNAIARESGKIGDFILVEIPPRDNRSRNRRPPIQAQIISPNLAVRK